MKTKKATFLFFIGTFSLLALLGFISFINGGFTKTEAVYGYIPAGEKVQISWPDTLCNPDMNIRVVVISTGDTIIAKVTDNTLHIPFGNWVQYHGIFPWGKGQKVFVEMLKQKGSPYLINRVSLEPWE